MIGEEMKEKKRLLYNNLLQRLDLQIDSTQKALQSTKESRDNETKSSVGDKYETGRAMMQLEQGRLESQLNKTLHLRKILTQINLEKEYLQVEAGAMVETDQGIYFISIGLGKVVLEDQTYFAISTAAPVSGVLLGKKVGEVAVFQGREFMIQNVC